jgi:predicted HicB family RNase H-like nuclease
MARVNGHALRRRTRLNMRIPTDLLEWAKVHAAEKNKSLTQLVVDHLTKLKEKADVSGTKTS